MRPTQNTLKPFSRGWSAIRDTDWLIKDILTANALAAIIGPPGSGKSFAALDLALSISTGLDFHGHPVTQGPVVYLAAEGLNGVYKRAQAWLLHHAIDPGDNLWIEERPKDLYSDGALEDYADHLAATLPSAPRLIVIDTLARVAIGMAENDNAEVSLFIGLLTEHLQLRFGATVLLIHHTAKGTTHARGASSLLGALDWQYNCAQLKRDADSIDIGMKLTCTKVKDSESPAPMLFDLKRQAITLPTGSLEVSLVPILYVGPGQEAALRLSKGTNFLMQTIQTLNADLSRQPTLSEVRESYGLSGHNASNLSTQVKTLSESLTLHIASPTPTKGSTPFEILCHQVAHYSETTSTHPASTHEI